MPCARSCADSLSHRPLHAAGAVSGPCPALPLQSAPLSVSRLFPWKSTPTSTASRTSPSAPHRSGGIFDYDLKKERLEEVLREQEDPALWNDPEKAQAIGRERVELEGIVLTLDRLASGLIDARDLLDLAVEEADEGTLNDVSAELDSLEKSVADLEFRRMFSGEMDPGNCFIDIQAGAGGTEAQDWASMLFRMYLRWIDRHGFKGEILEVSDGEVAGIKSATIRVEGPMPSAGCAPKPAYTGMVAITDHGP